MAIDFPVTEMKGPNQPLKMEAGSRFKITIQFDGCIDGSRTEGTAKFGMDLKGNAKIDAGNGKTLTLTVAIVNNRTEVVKELGKN